MPADALVLVCCSAQTSQPRVGVSSHAEQVQFTAAAAQGDDQSFFSLVKPPQERPLTEIVSSVKGDFDFLQDSVVQESPEARECAYLQAAALLEGEAASCNVIRVASGVWDFYL